MLLIRQVHMDILVQIISLFMNVHFPSLNKQYIYIHIVFILPKYLYKFLS